MLDYDFIYVFTEGGHQVFWGDAYVVWEPPMTNEERLLIGLTPHTRDEYLQAMADLLPWGAAWPRDPASPNMRLLSALAAEFERIDARAVQLYAEVDPASTSELLPDWERVVGLPDPCVTAAQTVAQRRIALEGRLTGVGGQSKAFFIELAARLGYTVTIETFASPAEATAAGVPYTGDEWAHIWRVHVPVAVAVVPFRVGGSTVGEPLRAWGNEVLECQFNRLKPAHTRVLFAYPEE